ncbi:MAG: helix-turn-helix transcriptional regulator [Spirochaetes bacterium]|nr:helix-turn-helix transcriptional regulator [Spirochaetota bacterium]
MNSFDRNLELSDGLETDYIRLLYYEFDHYYKDFYKSYEYYRLCTILNGSKFIEVNNQENFIYNKDGFVVLPPQSAVSMEIKDPTRCLVFELSDILLDKICDKACITEDFECNPLERETHPLFRGNTRLIQSDIKKITLTALGKAKNKEFLIDLYVQEMIYKLLSRMSAGLMLEKKINNPIYKAIELMKNFYVKNLDLYEIAHSLNMSPALFSIKFKKITGVSPHAYYMNIKLKEAKKLLKHSSVTEVAYDLGYDNISNFIKNFYEKYGLTPKQYQLHNLNNTL